MARSTGGRHRLVTLTSDLGWAYAAQMKAVLARSLPVAQVVDLAHDLPRHAIEEAAFVVRAMARSFPAGTVHLVVVDPGVGGRRAPIVIDCSDGSRLVGPDNGVLYPLAEALGLGPTYRISAERLGPSPRVGTTFDGRDLFAPAAACLARGTRPSALGPKVVPHRYLVPQPECFAGGASGEVVHIDRFGNLITNIPSGWVPSDCAQLFATVGASRSRRLPWAVSYEGLGPGRLGALGSSFGSVELAMANGSAADRWGARVGQRVRLRWLTKPRSGPYRK